MAYRDSHLSDEQLLVELDGELPLHGKKRVQAHLESCWKCRARRLELEGAIAGFVRSRQQDPDPKLPDAAGSRALLKARLAQLAAAQPRRLAFSFALAAAACGLLLVSVLVVRSPGRRPVIISAPDSRLTPGAALLVSRHAVCMESNAKNKTVPPSLQKKVFEAYGIPGATPKEYEVDYLITPALGGADDIHNLWPQSYSATVWNAKVKDALEDRLREMVCDGQIELTEAQQEIAMNWIAAYKKYFHTNQPIDGTSHVN